MPGGLRVAVLGAGVVGLACADELVRAGHDVTVFDPAPGNGATHAAAGMLAPGGEAWFGEEPLLRLGLASAALWPEFADRLGRDSGRPVPLTRTGTLVLGRDADDRTVVSRTRAMLEGAGVEVEPLTGREARRVEPGLSGRVSGGLRLPHERAVDPRAVAAALVARLGSRLVAERAAPVVRDGRVTAVIGDRGAPYPADAVVLATGADPTGPLARWLRPVRGETIRLRTDDPPGHTLRARVHGEAVYVVPRASGEVVVGATEEEHAGPARVTVSAVVRLLHAARVLLPGLDRADLLGCTARHRPGSPDNGPLLGPAGTAGLVAATGHYRAGVLLAPLTARVVRACVEGRPVPDVARPFDPLRFSSPPTPDRSSA